MRRIVLLLAMALVGVSSNSQELVSLALEPEVQVPSPTLESAARANDFPTFDALYRAKPDPAFRTLHELWTYSMTERTGAFYGPEMHDRLARAYPGYAAFIAQHRIVDSNGSAFYPVSETRAFLLGQPRAVAPRVVVAEKAVVGTKPAGSRRSGRLEAGATRAARAPAKTTKTVKAKGALAPLTTIVSEPAVAPQPAPAAVARVERPTPIVPAPRATNRGLLLIILGLIGVGLLALIVRAPKEVIQ